MSELSEPNFSQLKRECQKTRRNNYDDTSRDRDTIHIRRHQSCIGYSKLSDLDNAMIQRMIHKVHVEHTNFCKLDFLDLMKPKTYRNKICKLKKQGIVEDDYKSTNAYHTLVGHKFGRAGTHNHTGVTTSHNNPIYQMFLNLPMDKQCIHNIRLRLTVPDIYHAFSVNTTFPKDNRSGDIRLPYWNKNNAVVQVRIHRTDTVSIIVGCSLEPFPLDYNGIIRFFTTLASTEGLLVGMTLMIYNEKVNQILSIPDYRKWVITMWHFGRDGLLEFKGEKFSISVENADHIVSTIYSKDFGKYSKIRLDRQERPNNFVTDAIEEKLNSNHETSQDF